jgi:POT family proton-dependent oligopeptide transporter
MGQKLLLPGHVEHVAGFATFRTWIEQVYGPLSPAALASVIFGLYAGGVYATPLVGGFIADRFLGRTVTVTIGAVLMAAGHLLMAFEISFLFALGCLLLGVGCFKGTSPPRSVSCTGRAISAGRTLSRSISWASTSR